MLLIEQGIYVEIFEISTYVHRSTANSETSRSSIFSKIFYGGAALRGVRPLRSSGGPETAPVFEELVPRRDRKPREENKNRKKNA